MLIVKQYKLHGEDKELGKIMQELHRVGIVYPAHSASSSIVWPVQKPDGSWQKPSQKMNYWELNKVVLP